MGQERTFESFREALAYLKANEFGVLNHPLMDDESFLFVKTNGTLWFYDAHTDDVTPQGQSDIIELSDPVEWPPIDARKGHDTWAYYPGDQFEVTNGGVEFFDQLRRAPAMIESNLTTKMRKLVESMELHEGYEERIAQAAQLVKGMSKAEILTKISRELELAQSGYGVGSELLSAMPEFKLRSKTAAEAKRDLLSYMSKNKMLARAKGVRGPSTRAPYYVMSDNYSDEAKVPVTHEEVSELGDKLLQWAGESFPDGDPNDRVYHWMKRKGWDVGDGYDRIMPVACKKYLGTKNYSEYLAQLWDDVYADKSYEAAERAKNPKGPFAGDDDVYRAMGGDDAQNPWR